MQAQSYPNSVLTPPQELASGRTDQRSGVSDQSDGLRISALLTVPNGTPPAGGWPAIVFNHGFSSPERQSVMPLTSMPLRELDLSC